MILYVRCFINLFMKFLTATPPPQHFKSNEVFVSLNLEFSLTNCFNYLYTMCLITLICIVE